MDLTLADIRPTVSSAQEFLDRLVAASAAGRLPARGPRRNGTSNSEMCRYLTSDGRQCGIGLLYSADDAGRLDDGDVAAVSDHRDLFDTILPPWLSVGEARALQRLHDCLTPWDHSAWVASLLAMPVFSGLTAATPGDHS